ncbi:SDR family oxidoreductase [Verticiella sediminum]|uniref:SDR family oxidoreductase n=1 Tax=Verticiella sediminum TaxID=1247510 RepID=A0A556AEC0_9BURK|nr:SDR family oxidoreductase [Verticiella sediminum]TSH91227.1 SDR family oxidoreductase [Verticiella sediminum]
MDTPRTAVVTGAAGEIGRAICAALLSGGHRVVAVDRSADALDEAFAGVAGDAVRTCCIDLGEADAAQRIDSAVPSGWAGVDILVNNAAISPKQNGKTSGLAELSLQEWNEVLLVNTTVPMLLARHWVPSMARRGWGRVVNISSRAGRSQANAAGPSYMTSKAAILGLTRSIASEFANRGVTANAVAPGLVSTHMTRQLSEDMYAAICSRIPMARTGQPAEIAAAVAFLASDGAGYVTGACLDVNGGAFMT